MSLFGKKTQVVATGGALVATRTTTVSAKDENIKSLIAEGNIFSGNMELRSGIKIDGMVIGDITVSTETGTVVVNKGATVEGRIKAPRVYVLGTVVGNIEAGGVVVATGASVVGDISYDAIRVADGADIEGQIRRLQKERVVSSVEPVAHERDHASTPSGPVLRVATA